MLRASVNIPGPIPSEPNFSNILDEFSSRGTEGREAETLEVFLFALLRKSGIKPIPNAISPTSRPDSGINTNSQSQLSDFKFCGVAPMLTAIMWARSPSAAFGGASVLLQ